MAQRTYAISTAIEVIELIRWKFGGGS
jgi:hypothetical protein